MWFVYVVLVSCCLRFPVRTVMADGQSTCTNYNEVLPTDGACSEYLQNTKIALKPDDIAKRDAAYKKLTAAISLAKTLSKDTMELMIQLALTSCPDENVDKIISLVLPLLSKSNIDDYSTCLSEQKWVMCHSLFPVCLESNKNEKSIVSLPCRENCERFRGNAHCSKLIQSFQAVLDHAYLCPKAGHLQDVYLHMGLKDCDKYKNRNHNFFTQCQLREPASENMEKSTSCYETGKKIYHGDISISKNGKTCLNWNVERLPHKLYPTLMKNYCRNPQGYGHKPWCYVSNNGDWEYCDVRNCQQMKTVHDRPSVDDTSMPSVKDAPPPPASPSAASNTPILLAAPPVQEIPCNVYQATDYSFCSDLDGLSVALSKKDIKNRDKGLGKFMTGIQLAHTMRVEELPPLLELVLNKCHSQSDKEQFIKETVKLFPKINFKDIDSCLNNNRRLICQLVFPLCFKHKNEIVRSNLCYESCIEYETKKPCSSVIELIKKASNFTNLCLDKIKSRYLHEGIKDCKYFKRKNIKAIEKCQLSSAKSTAMTKSDTCHEKDKTTYVGTLSVTKSGQKCLPWNTELPTKLYPTLESNYCRNPQGYGSQPWCYVGLNGEWEYCEIDQCIREQKHKAKKQYWFYILAGSVMIVFVAAFVTIIIRRRKRDGIKMEPVNRNEYQDEWLQTRYIPVSPPVEVYTYESDVDKKT